MGALGFEPRSAGVFRFICNYKLHGHLEPAVLPGYTIPPRVNRGKDKPYLISAVTDALVDGRAFSFEASSYATSSAGCLASSRLVIRASCDFPTCPPYISATENFQKRNSHSSSSIDDTTEGNRNSSLIDSGSINVFV